MPPVAATKVSGVRITRRNGAYRQPYEVENANRRARQSQGAPVTVSYNDSNEESAYEFETGRLKVVTERLFTPNVPFSETESKFSYEDMPNPVNQLGAVFEENVPVVTSNDYASFIAAFNKRCNFQQEGEDDDITEEAFNKAVEIINNFQVPDEWLEWDENDEDREEWLQGFAPDKRARMVKAWNEHLVREGAALGHKDLSVKAEVLLKRNDPEWAPRVIYAGTDEFNAVTGPAAKIVMSRMVEAFSKARLGVVKVKLAYKTNDVALTEFLDDGHQNGHPTVVEGDFSANDREQRQKVHKLFNIWLAKLRMPQWLRNLLSDMNSFTVANYRFGITALIKHQLPTGTTFTTARNSFYNAVMFAVACALQHVTSALATILGDDILAVLRGVFSLVLWKQCVNGEFKMKLKGKTPKLNGQATLLSRRLIIDGDTRCMVPLIGKALARFNVRATTNEAVSDSTYMAGKALSYAYEFRHVPKLRDAFLERYEMEDGKGAVTLDELTWFTRTSGVDLSQLVEAIKNERVLVDDYMLLDWLTETYDLGFYELDELINAIILNKCVELIDLPGVHELSIDW